MDRDYEKLNRDIPDHGLAHPPLTTGPGATPDRAETSDQVERTSGGTAKFWTASGDALRAVVATARPSVHPDDAMGSDLREVLLRIAAQELVALVAVTELANERARALRAAASVIAAETVADDVVRTASTVRLRVAESALRVARAAAEAAAFAAASVLPGDEALAARNAARVALAATTEAMAVAEEAGVAASVVAEAAGAAAVDMAALTADTEMTIELAGNRAVSEIRAFVGETARRLVAEAAEAADAADAAEDESRESNSQPHRDL